MPFRLSRRKSNARQHDKRRIAIRMLTIDHDSYVETK